MARNAEGDQHIGRGMYDLDEAARLVGRDAGTIARWVSGPNALVSTFGRSLSFPDVVSLRVVSELRNRNVPMADIRRGRSYLADELSTQHPFAHQHLATAGTGFFASLPSAATWLDVGQSGQLAFQEFVEPFLERIRFGDDGLADRWQPADGVSLDPEIQAGAACITGTRCPTRLVADLFGDGFSPDEIAEDYALTLRQVETAIGFENSLGLAA